MSTHSVSHQRYPASTSALSSRPQPSAHRHQRFNSTAATACSLRGQNTHDLNPLRQHPLYYPSSLDDTTFDDIQLSAPSPAITHTSTHYQPDPSPIENYTQPPYGHQRSLTDTFLDNCRPFVDRANSTIQQHSKGALHSPTKSLASFISNRGSNASEEDRGDGASSPTKRGSKLSNLFAGASAHINIGLVPSKTPRHVIQEEEVEEDSEDEMFTTNSAPAIHRRTTSQSTTSKFSWLLPSVTAKSSQGPSPPPSRQASSGDELYNLNVQHALFPFGQADPLDPASFNDLLANAESIIQRYQSAYRSQSAEIAELKMEQSVQDEECDELETRSRHLKIQLDDMAARAAEQDRAMQDLKKQLEQERQLRIAEEEARLRRSSNEDSHSPADWSLRNPKRMSNSAVSFSDSGFDSESELASSASSVNFDSPSPNWQRVGALAPPSTCTLASLQAAQPQEAIAMPMSRARVAPPKRQSSFGKTVLRRIQQEEDDHTPNLSNTQWQTQQGAWNVVRNVREENASLHRRVNEVEYAVDDALEFIRACGL